MIALAAWNDGRFPSRQRDSTTATRVQEGELGRAFAIG
jgi:hypothetical protein